MLIFDGYHMMFLELLQVLKEELMQHHISTIQDKYHQIYCHQK